MESVRGPYAELLCRTYFSFLRGASSPEELIAQASELGISALGITDRNGVYGVPKAYHARKVLREEGRPSCGLLVGAELTVEGRALPILVRDRAAYGLLCRALTASHAGKEKGAADLRWEEFSDFAARPEARGWLGFAWPEIWAPEPARPDLPEPENRLGDLHDLFQDRLSLPLARVLDGLDRKRTERARVLSRRHDLSIVATNDVHCHIRERFRVQNVLTSIRVGKSLDQAGFQVFPNEERRLKSPEEMRALFQDLPAAIDRTLELAESCHFCPSELRYRYPSEWIPAGHTAQSFLEELSWKGAETRYGGPGRGLTDQHRKQLRHELSLISKLGYADYFLTIHEIVDFAKSRDILCQGRGAAANSVVCYCLGITAVDPVERGLLFERFISEERGEPPDIDVDFEHERREEVLQHVYEKYGRDRAAMVSAVVTYRRRSAFREVAKALGVDVGVSSAKKLQNQFAEAVSRGGVQADPRQCERMVEELATEMDGFPRHLSIHSGGFTLSADPIIEIVPVEPARMEGRTIIQWDKYDLDYLGLLKVDLLSLGMLSALKRMLTLTGRKLYEIPPDDPPTYEMIQKADTVGTFQIESRAQMSMLGRLKPEKFYDLVVEVAIVRPGPITGKMVHPYLRRKRGEEPVDYPDPRVEEILKRTLGVPLFQEQVMQMAVSLAGFTPGESDELRRAIGAWRSSGSIEKVGRRLMDGLTRSGIPVEYSRRIFDQIQGFADYGFPESHAISFAMIAYASSFMKRHHPAEFSASLINSQPMGFYSNHTLVEDARRHGVRILPIHPEASDWECRVVAPSSSGSGGSIRLGFNIVNGLGKADAERWIAERQARPFESIEDFVARVPLKAAVLERLAMGGAFECFGQDRRKTLWRILECRVLREGSEGLCDSQKPWVQLGLFGEGVRAGQGATKPSFRALSPLQSIQEEYDAFKLSPQSHPMPELRRQLKLPTLTTLAAKELQNGREITVSGQVIVRQRPPTAKGMCFATLEDETGFLDLVLHPPVYERYREEFLSHCFITVIGKLQREGNTRSVVVRALKPVLAEWEVEPIQFFNPMRKFGTVT